MFAEVVGQLPNLVFGLFGENPLTKVVLQLEVKLKE
jgi:hypothetical protein